MQTITRGASNTVVLTLTERVTLTNPYFLVRAESRRTAVVKRFILGSNLSSATERYDKFTIIENAVEDLPNATVTLTGGDWWYEVYEQTSSSNLLETSATNTTPLEKGLFRVIDTNDTYKDPAQIDTYVDA